MPIVREVAATIRVRVGVVEGMLALLLGVVEEREGAIGLWVVLVEV